MSRRLKPSSVLARFGIARRSQKMAQKSRDLPEVDPECPEGRHPCPGPETRTASDFGWPMFLAAREELGPNARRWIEYRCWLGHPHWRPPEEER